MPFKAHKSKVIQVGLRKKTFHYEMSGVNLTSVQCLKDLAVKIASNLKSSQHFLDAANNASSEPRLTGRYFSFRDKSVIDPLPKSLLRPHLAHAVQSPRHAKD